MIYDQELKELKLRIPFEISDEEVISFSLDISRSSDSKITRAINEFKRNENLKVTSKEKEKIRDFLIGNSVWPISNVSPINRKDILSDEDIKKSLEILIYGIKRSPQKVLGTLKSRLQKKRNGLGEKIRKYEKFFLDLERDQIQLLILKVTPEKGLLERLKSAIITEYDRISNYHYLAVIFEDSDDEVIEWEIISKCATFCEFLKSEKNFKLFNREKDKRIKELSKFIQENKNIIYTRELEDRIKDFYNGVSYGFQFCDLLVSKDAATKVLIFQKIELDETPYPCPDCMKTLVRGNSYPKLLQKSFECQNPDCPSRSKIGRGKRYDLLSVKRNLMLELNSENDSIPMDFAKKFRRDVFDYKKDVIEMLVRFYSWNKNRVLIIRNDKNTKLKQFLGRLVSYKELSDYKGLEFTDSILDKLLSSIVKNIKIVPEKPKRKKVEENFSIYCGDSSNIIPTLTEKITGAITSPPYYNVREYSQWPNFICYLIDMAINAKAVFEKLEDRSYYFYNIGDIVAQDNVFIASHMSRRRLMLGFYSAEIFQKIGFKFINNIIWDKGEVQSKRNSNQNLFPGYIKPINSYEHIMIFGKGENSIKLQTKVLALDTVKKINSKGENILGHTAPYPEELVTIIFPFINKVGHLLDPFLGSGTTVLASNKNGIKSVGIELNEKYYFLALERVLSINNTLLGLLYKKNRT